ncbi:MAG: hypothetical protein FWH04_08480 [Oscillospiraceae bacterium]|nr:hypothetical protein [Oscillospiraceae bacterium]
MGRVITIWGSPNSGRSTFAIKLAREIYETKKEMVICIFTDNQTPTLPVLFPHHRKDNLPSIGSLLAKPAITTHELLTHMVPADNMAGTGFLGYTGRDNRYTHPEPLKEHANLMIELAAQSADTVIIDCAGNLDWTLNQAAVLRADTVFQLHSPTLKSVSFFSSQLPLYQSFCKQKVSFSGLVETEPCSPSDQVRHYFQNISFIIPHCPALKWQMAEGQLLASVTDRKWNGAMKSIVGMVTAIDN